MHIFKNLVGYFCAGAGILFLAINSGILARGAARWGYAGWEQVSYGAVAATVPWVIAAMPFLISLSWVPGRRFGRPSMLTLIGCLIWLVFVAYNLAGAAGSVALVRDEVITNRAHLAGNLHANVGTRKRLTDEFDAIPRHRPAGTLAPLLAAEKARPEWERTEKCTDVRRGKDVKFCQGVTTLESELASAKRAAELGPQLAAINAKIEVAPAASEKVDPQARIIASFTGWDESYISERIPAATPIVLELGSMSLIYFSFVLLGFFHRTVLRTSPKFSEQLQEPRKTILPRPPVASLTRSRELCEWFFKESCRPATSGSLPEGNWYRYYEDVCKQSNDVPLPLISFRRIAQQFILEMPEIDGVIYYKGALPYIPQRAA